MTANHCREHIFQECHLTCAPYLSGGANRTVEDLHERRLFPVCALTRCSTHHANITCGNVRLNVRVARSSRFEWLSVHAVSYPFLRFTCAPTACGPETTPGIAPGTTPLGTAIKGRFKVSPKDGKENVAVHHAAKFIMPAV